MPFGLSDSTWHNTLATLASFGVCVGEMKILEFLQARGLISRDVSRKWIHILTGPLYLVCWYLFDDSEYAKYWACTIPLAMSLKVGAVGAGIIKDPAFVNSMSRSGRPSELLLGPFSYGAIFVASTLLYWRHSPGGIISMLLLCIGDGFAGFLGYKYGKLLGALPHNKAKSWVGSLAFFSLSIPAILSYYRLFNHWSWLNYPIQQNWKTVVGIVGAATAIESLPLGDWDNVIVFLSSVLMSRWLY